ncbi:DUF2066 domain-containing protein [Endothiovibrio diazotrophicus]
MNRSPSQRSPFRRWLRVALWIGLLVCVVLSLKARAAETVALFEAEVPVAGQDADARLQAERAALGEVLVRVSGNRQAAAHPALAPMLEEAGRYVQQYRYVDVPLPGAGAGGMSEPHLWVSFDAQAVERALRQVDLPVWGRLRPSVLAWLAVADGSERFLVGGEQGFAVRDVLQRVGARRGTPLLFPIMDLEDQARVRFADVWAGFADAIVTHSQRYGANGVVVGRVYRDTAGRWSGNWSLYLGGESERWEGRADGRDALLEAAANALADRLAERFALLDEGGDEGPLKVRVAAVTGLADYARVERYLRSLPPVTAVQLERVVPGELLYRVEARGGRQALAETIALGHTLRPLESASAGRGVAPIEAGAPSSGGPEELRYRLSP